jgi:signal peptidase I
MRRVDQSRSAAESALKCELAAEVLRSFGTLRFAATGWSMLPSVWPGETLVVERVRPDQVRIGDVVVVRREGGFCAHRVIGTEDAAENRQWITQGDAMAAPDPPVAGSDLLGRVAYLIRAGKPVAVPAELNMVERLTAKIVRRSVPVARALVYLHRMIQTSERSAPETSAAEKSVLPCQG